jgi:hypothetical protein
VSLPGGWDRLVRECPSCRRPVLWAVTHNGKRMPLDPAVDDQGNTAVHRDATGTLAARVLTREFPTAAPFEVLLVPHFATCTNRPGHPPSPATLPENVIPIGRRGAPGAPRITPPGGRRR